jgi:hypothetical protein
MSETGHTLRERLRRIVEAASGFAASFPLFSCVTSGELQEVCADAAAVLAARDAENERLRELLASGEASDGYHTHRELYEYRMLYNAHAARGWLAAGIPVVRSWRHSDGELCFGGGWFIVSADLPTGQVSNHYMAACWDLFSEIPEVDLPPEYDGHTPSDVAERLRAALNQGET